MHKLRLTNDEIRILADLQLSHKINEIERKRVKVMLLFNEGFQAREISKKLKINYDLVLDIYNRWIDRDGLESIFDSFRHSNKSKIDELSLNFLVTEYKKDRTQSYDELSEKLRKHNRLEVTGESIRKIFKIL